MQEDLGSIPSFIHIGFLSNLSWANMVSLQDLGRKIEPCKGVITLKGPIQMQVFGSTWGSGGEGLAQKLL